MSLQMNDGIIPMTSIQLRIIKKLASGTSIARKELVKILKSPRTTIFDNLVKLQKQKLVKKYSRNNGIRGRPIVYWFIPRKVLKQIKYR